jgi:hypothetical protein
MRHFLYLFSIVFVFFVPVRSIGQLNHFIYLQSENKQPFYVKMNKTIYNSTASGYLIIPKLQDGTYNFHLGFVNNTQNKEYEFSCSINNKDNGYLVKNFSDKGWGLFNLQSLQVVMSGTKEPEVAQTSKTDAFSNLLSDVVNDPSIKQENITPSGNEKKEEQQIVSASTKSESLPVSEAKSQDSMVKDKLDTPALDRTVINSITKHEIVTTAEGLSITYIDSSFGGTADTINIFMPAAPVQIDTVIKKDKEDSFPQPDLPVAAVEGQKTNNDPPQQSTVDTQSGKALAKESTTKFLEIDLPAEQAKTDSGGITKGGTSKPLTANALMINSDCKTIASEEDFMKLRKKIASARSVEEMIASAKKTFRLKCFTTDQVKNLGVLFLKDADRYNFFDISYPFVSDSYNFKMLEDQLTDTYYKTRFQAMIRH